MTAQTLPQTQQSPAAALPGTWKLGAGRAISLQPKEAGTLQVAHGQLWATFDGPHSGPLNDQGDLIIGVGDRIRLRAGQRLVIESWNWQSPSYFSWDPLPIPLRSAAPRLAVVVQPLADLRLALVFGAGAIARLMAGLGGLAWDLVAGRKGNLADCALNAQARACRAHGAMS